MVCQHIFVYTGSYAPRFPRPGESVRGNRFACGQGGKGANQAVQSAKLGARVTFVGCVGGGADAFGPATVLNMQAQGIDCGWWECMRFMVCADNLHALPSASTGTATITVTDNGENSIVIVQGANDLLTVEHVRAARAHIAASAVLCCQLEVPFAVDLEAMRIAKENNVTTVFNPAPGIMDLPVELLANADIVCPNENEAEMLSLSAADSLRTVDDARRMADVIQQRARTVRGPNMPAPTVIVTLGPRGCILMASDGSAQHVECPRVTAVDTTGAGDSFIGALAYYISKHSQLPLREQVARAMSIASHSVQSAGTQTSYATKQDLPGDLFL